MREPERLSLNKVKSFDQVAPTSHNNRVAAFAHFVRSGVHGSESRAGNS